MQLENLTKEQIDEMKKNIYNIDYELASKKEKEFRFISQITQ